MTHHLVIVESPAKSRTIQQYLGKDYEVLASFGHVRDLPSKDGMVRPEEQFAMTYAISEGSEKHIRAIAKAVKDSDTLYLATDPDREGEAISWHVLEALRESGKLPKKTAVKRIVFHEITKKAVTEAIKHPRDLDMDLVNAQQARRALDYLVGFSLSPILWRKLPGSRSAGRVQSVALRLICDREQEIESFISEEYWYILGRFATEKGVQIEARLSHWQGEKLEKFSFRDEASAKAVVEALCGRDWAVKSVTPKQVRRNPYPPFTTSTLQQEAARKLGFGAKRTMQVAQKLYEGVNLGSGTTGLITYMRTDGVTVSGEAIAQARDLIGSKFGKDYLPGSPRQYKTKAKNAQEAHEAIRPTDVTRTPESVAGHLDADQLALYTLIWKRMLASQMESARLDQVAVEIADRAGEAIFRATGSVVAFDGFLALYDEGKDDEEEGEDGKRLPKLSPSEVLTLREPAGEQHFTQPPPRFSEASLVKQLEELGIGRPSTYAAILSVLQDRGYVKLEKKRFMPEGRGRLVTAFLVRFFGRYVEPDFTARIEEKLDLVSNGDAEWKAVLGEFWERFHVTVETVGNEAREDILKAVEEYLEALLFPVPADGSDPHRCPDCADGRLHLKTSRYGAFAGCSNYPDCRYTKPLFGEEEAAGDGAGAAARVEPQALGTEPESGLAVLLKKGPYGFYVQLGEEGGKQAKRAGLPKEMNPEAVTLEIALGLLSLPRELGPHPETGETILAGIGRYGPYIKHQSRYISLKGEDDVLTIGMNRAVDLIAEDGSKGKGAKAEPLKTLGEHPAEGGEVAVYDGRYGPYVKHKKTNASLPKGADPQALTMDEAVALLEARRKKAKKK